MKGSVVDSLLLSVFLLVLVISFFISSIVGKEIIKTVNESEIAINKTLVTQYVEKTNLTIDILITSIPYIIFSFGISSIVLAFLIPTHRIFLPLAIISLAIFGFFSIVFKNVIVDFVSQNIFVNILSNQPFLIFVINNIHIITLVFGVLIIFVMYIRTGEENEESI